jgi:hypothetical protein
LSAKKGLRTEEAVREIRVNEDVFVERDDVAIVVEGFPVGVSNIFNGKTTGNTSENNGVIELSNGGWVNVGERVGGGVGTSTVNNASEGMRIVSGEFLENMTGGSQLAVEDAEVFGVEGRGLKVANTRSVAAKVVPKVNVTTKGKGMDFGEGAAKQPED